MKLLIGEIPEWVEGIFPLEPIKFQRIPHKLIGPYCYFEIGKRPMAALRVICSGSVMADGKRWLHVSASKMMELPSWDDMRLVKDTFLGDDRKAIQIFPKKSEYVNIHQNVLHLWSCIDGDPIPDMRVEGQI